MPYKSEEMTGGKVAAIGCLGVFALVLLIPAVAILFEPPSKQQAREQKSWEQDAHFTAEQFVRKSYPAVLKVSDFRDSIVTSEGATYLVALTVDMTGPLGGPVRKIIGVELRLAGEKWTLIAMRER